MKIESFSYDELRVNHELFDNKMGKSHEIFNIDSERYKLITDAISVRANKIVDTLQKASDSKSVQEKTDLLKPYFNELTLPVVMTDHLLKNSEVKYESVEEFFVAVLLCGQFFTQTNQTMSNNPSVAITINLINVENLLETKKGEVNEQ
jgi:hypothetical protein